MKQVKALVPILFILFLNTSFLPSAPAQTDFFNMSYVYFGSPNSYSKQVDATRGSLKVVSPNYFDITPAGELEITWRLQTSFIDEMHRRGMKVVPFLANHWDATAGRNGLLHREKLAQDIAAAVERYKLDGVNVDIEGVSRSGEHSGYLRSYRDEHTDFIRLLRQYIPKHKEVSVAVAGNPSGWQTGWHGFYDYMELAKYADYLMLMAYDESWESPESPIGPVSSLAFFERSILYAIQSGVPKEKIVVGLPFYGRMWKLDGPTLEGRNITGLGLSSTRIAPLIREFKGKSHYDKSKESPYVTFTIPKNQHGFIGTTKLTEGQYVIWFENEQSIKAKLQLISKYGIKGTGSWALFHETPETWEYYSHWLNGTYFKDVALGHWGRENILSVSNRGWITGTTSTTFSPNATLTRAQGALILIRALGYAQAFPKEFLFTDIKGHWARREIEVARELGMIHGLDLNRFGPDEPLTESNWQPFFRISFTFPQWK